MQARYRRTAVSQFEGKEILIQIRVKEILLGLIAGYAVHAQRISRSLQTALKIADGNFCVVSIDAVGRSGKQAQINQPLLQALHLFALGADLSVSAEATGERKSKSAITSDKIRFMSIPPTIYTFTCIITFIAKKARPNRRKSTGPGGGMDFF